MNYVLMTILIGFLKVVCFSAIAISHLHILIVHVSEGNLETAVGAGSPNIHLPPPVSLDSKGFNTVCIIPKSPLGKENQGRDASILHS